MQLYIDTTKNEMLIIGLKKGGSFVFREEIGVERNQAEKLLPSIKDLLEKNKIKLANIKEIVVNNKGGGFTGLRIGVITANALGFALQIPVNSVEKPGKKVKSANFSVVKPEYDAEPNISYPK